MGDSSRNYLVRIYQETERCFEKLEKSFGGMLKKGAEETVVYREAPRICGREEEVKETPKDCHIEVLPMDTLDAALSLLRADYDPLILNMASDQHPGGGYRTGAVSQEEELFRRTTYALSLEQSKVTENYPLVGNACVYSPSVLIFRDNRTNKYEQFKFSDCLFGSFLALPALRRPKLQYSRETRDNRLTESDTNIALNKIRTLFEIARFHKHDSLVLGAWGCGAYGNPPKQIAQLFRQVIREYTSAGLRKIVFAILSDVNDQEGNYQIFREVLKK